MGEKLKQKDMQVIAPPPHPQLFCPGFGNLPPPFPLRRGKSTSSPTDLALSRTKSKHLALDWLRRRCVLHMWRSFDNAPCMQEEMLAPYILRKQQDQRILIKRCVHTSSTSAHARQPHRPPFYCALTKKLRLCDRSLVL